MAIKFQYNKTSLQTLEKQLKVRVKALPTIKSKESALRVEVKRARDEVSVWIHCWRIKSGSMTKWFCFGGNLTPA